LNLASIRFGVSFEFPKVISFSANPSMRPRLNRIHRCSSVTCGDYLRNLYLCTKSQKNTPLTIDVAALSFGLEHCCRAGKFKERWFGSPLR
jgi:hypothetical protein